VRDAHTPDALTTTGEQRITRRIELAFAPLHKAALGVAMAVVAGCSVAIVTGLDLMLDPHRQVPLSLLAQYFHGYDVTPVGALIGGAWGMFAGFIAGWFVAFTRNAAMALWVIYFRARADWKHTRDFLDHI
jgi:hypothetical protein